MNAVSAGVWLRAVGGLVPFREPDKAFRLSVKHWSLTTLREKLIKIGAKVVRHAKYVTFQMAEVAVPRELFAAILERIQRFGVPPPLVQRG